MGRFCILCESIRPNEAFGGKGERARICRKCRRMPREKQDALKQEREIHGFVEQSHISKKNVARLRALASSSTTQVAYLATLVLEVPIVTPYRRRRIRTLARRPRRLTARQLRRLRGAPQRGASGGITRGAVDLSESHCLSTRGFLTWWRAFQRDAPQSLLHGSAYSSVSSIDLKACRRSYFATSRPRRLPATTEKG